MSLCIRTVSNKFPPFVNTQKCVSKIDRLSRHVRSSFLNEIPNTPAKASMVTNFKEKPSELCLIDPTCQQSFILSSLITSKDPGRRLSKRYVGEHYQTHFKPHKNNFQVTNGATSKTKDDLVKHKIRNDRCKIMFNYDNCTDSYTSKNYMATTYFSGLYNKHTDVNFSKHEVLAATTNVSDFEKANTSEEGESSETKLDRVFNTLSNDLPKFFSTRPDYSIYTEDLEFIDNIRGKVLHGLYQYVKHLNILKIYGYIKFAYVKVEVLKMTIHPDENIIKVRWTVKGLSTWKSIVFLCKRKISINEYLRSQESWYDGFSTFYVNDDGKVFKHIVDKIISDQHMIRKEEKVPIPTKLASYFTGLSGVYMFINNALIKTKF